MTDRPIIFSTPMVVALLAGRKTQTRRILGTTGPGRGRFNIFNAETAWADSYVMDPGNAEWREKCTPYAPGDRLWVREAWGLGLSDHGDCPRYRATMDYQCGDKILSEHESPFRWRPSIHMPRRFSRLTLHVTEVRVQRLQEISEEDALAEGVGRLTITSPKLGTSITATDGFRDLWNSLHGADAWDANKWVAAISFTVERANIDQVAA
jgi:hypothetical protein